MPFQDRKEAGRRLAAALAHHQGDDAVVLALPRGGVPVAAEVADALRSPLDLIIVRKIGAPFHPELAMGAVAEAGETVRNTDVISMLGVDEETFQSARAAELEEIDRRFPDEVGATARSPFRSDTDLSLLSSFAEHYALLTGTAYAGQVERAYINISNSDLEWQLKKALERQQDFLCLADHHDHALHAERLDRTLTEFMATYFPVAAPWELDR